MRNETYNGERWGLCADGGLLCQECTEGGNGSLAEIGPYNPRADGESEVAQWRVVQRCSVADEAECAHCGAEYVNRPARWQARVDRNLKGCEFVSPGISCGCAECRDGFDDYRVTDEYCAAFKCGQRLRVLAHNSEPGKGLSYPEMFV